MAKPYSKETQLRAGTPQAEQLVANFRSRGNGRKTTANKYGAQKQPHGGRMYDSKAEADYAAHLDMMQLAGDIVGYKPQFTMNLVVNSIKITTYRIDFLVERSDGALELHEVKGAETKDWLIKWRLAQALIPMGAVAGVPKNAALVLVKRANSNSRWTYSTPLMP